MVDLRRGYPNGNGHTAIVDYLRHSWPVPLRLLLRARRAVLVAPYLLPQSFC
jgi:hypothetical protein